MVRLKVRDKRFITSRNFISIPYGAIKSEKAEFLCISIP